jgi:hypothetical protein
MHGAEIASIFLSQNCRYFFGENPFKKSIPKREGKQKKKSFFLYFQASKSEQDHKLAAAELEKKLAQVTEETGQKIAEVIRVARFFLVQHTKTFKIYQNRENIPNDHKIHHMTIKYTI